MVKWGPIAVVLVAAAAVGYLLFRKSEDDDYSWLDHLPIGGNSVAEKPLLTSEQARAQQLLPQVQRALQQLQDALRAEGIDTYIGSTKRTEAQQAAVLAKGTSSTKNSWHLLRRAVDLYPRDPKTKQPDLNGKNVALFKRMHDLAVKFGWRGLAFNPDGSKRYITTSKGKVWDGGHLEFPEGMTFAQAAKAGGYNA